MQFAAFFAYKMFDHTSNACEVVMKNNMVTRTSIVTVSDCWSQSLDFYKLPVCLPIAVINFV